MKLMKKLTLLSTALLMGATTMLGISKAASLVKAEEIEEVTLPSSITDSIYRYARAIGDGPDYVDSALVDWLNATDNLSGLPFFDTDPEEYDAATHRKTKNSFYVLAYLQEYIVNGTGESKDPIQAVREILDHTMEIKTDFLAFVDSAKNNNYEDAYAECKTIYKCFYDTAIAIENNVYSTFFKPVERFIESAKKYLQKSIDGLDDFGFDESLNKYSYFKSALNGFGALTKKDFLINREYTTEIIDYVLFDENTHINTYFSKDFIDFSLDDYNTAAMEAGIETQEEYEEFSAPYLQKLDRQMFAYLVTFNFALTYVNDQTSINTIINNCGPLLYKILDYVEAKRDNDSPNIVILSFQVMEDLEILLGTLGLNENKKDLKYEKFIANMRLGSLVYKENTQYKFAKFLINVNEINKVSLVGSTYEECVVEINNLLGEGYKDLNVDIVPSSEQAVLFFANGLENLASRQQAYSFELRKMLNHDHAFPIQGKMQDDYGNNMLYVNIIWIDMVLTDKNTNQEIVQIEDPIDVIFGIYNLQIGTDIKIYRYDEANDAVISLSNEATESGTDYFDLSIDDVTVHTRNFGTFAIAFINRLIKEEVENFRAEVAALKAQIVSKDATIAQLQNKITELEGKITTLESDITVKQALIDSLRVELNDAKALLNEKINEISSLEATIKIKNTLNIIFIILTCLFAASTVGLITIHLLKKKKEQK